MDGFTVRALWHHVGAWLLRNGMEGFTVRGGVPVVRGYLCRSCHLGGDGGSGYWGVGGHAFGVANSVWH